MTTGATPNGGIGAEQETIYVLGGGAVGFPLAVYLVNAGRRAIVVRTSRGDVARGAVDVTVRNGAMHIRSQVETISLAKLPKLDGTIVVATKAFANAALARALTDRAATGSIVLLQNGIGVERPFLDAGFAEIYRGVLYVTGQAAGTTTFSFRPVTASPIGVVEGTAAGLQHCVATLTTAGFPFRVEPNIGREVWKKAIINAVFNSVCPLLDVDNGVFVRDARTARLAEEIVRECVAVTDRLGLGLSEQELLDQLHLISERSNGQLISTLQDLRNGRPTEIAFLNLEIARVAAALQPPVEVPRTELLGQLIDVKSSLSRSGQPSLVAEVL